MRPKACKLIESVFEGFGAALPQAFARANFEAMTFYLLINHLLNFMAPAVLIALLLTGGSHYFPRFFTQEDAPASRWPVQLALNFAVGLGVLLLGLLVLGRDGKMMTYLALILATATSQWWQLGGGRKGWEVLKKQCMRRR